MERHSLRRGAAGAALALLAATAGCSSSSLVNMWRDPQYQAAPMRSIFVVALRKDPVHRRIWEDAFVHQLTKESVTATPSYQMFPDQLPDSETIAAHMVEKGYDGMILTSRVGEQEVATYVPGYVTKEPVTVFRPMWGTYVTYYRDVYHPGYTEADSSVHVRTDVGARTSEGGKLVWSGTSATIDPRNANQFSHSVSDLVVGELKKQRLIP
jgi:hypothetical protein